MLSGNVLLRSERMATKIHQKQTNLRLNSRFGASVMTCADGFHQFGVMVGSEQGLVVSWVLV